MITLQRDNVVRRVASDEAARKLEEQGFARTGGIAEIDNAASVGLHIDLDALADKLAERLKAGDPLIDETIAKALLDEDKQPAKPAAKPKGGGKAAPKAGAAHDGN